MTPRLFSAARASLLKSGPTRSTTNGGAPFGGPQGPQIQHILHSLKTKQNKNPYEVRRKYHIISFIYSYHLLLISYSKMFFMFYWSVVCVCMQILSLLNILHPLPSSLTCALIWVPITPPPNYCNTFLSAPSAPGLLVYATRLDSSVWVICLLYKSDHATPLLKIFQWLPIAFRMKTKQASMTHTGRPMIQPLPALSSLVLITLHPYLISLLVDSRRFLPILASCHCSTHLSTFSPFSPSLSG